ncbi:Right origin-binding protein [Arsenophonus endosymbiont of Aleurodicus floccissimus]|uniref:helix-turn-helix domain-containing protein n=1 Tax=Arsenophonus endosymbiont of Aleurodicus floccissimus TaxID=2152761 RepID=UPI000E6B1BEE|nr:helix-turn-helix domain-containing protein [Arsenophonus endosymbiont of Aleurodicus floccissimus]SPP31120.1 Right origin-binding protein [Arsenophonus endosymbiont of Aleurodicus floccissimus]
MSENVINDIVNWLESQLQRNEGIKIDTIANKSGYSKWHLQWIFKQLKGCTLGEYARKRRLLEAARLLREDKFSILDIALQYGFSSQATFTRIFKKHFNTTPAKFRQNGQLPDFNQFMD